MDLKNLNLLKNPKKMSKEDLAIEIAKLKKERAQLDEKIEKWEKILKDKD